MRRAMFKLRARLLAGAVVMVATATVGVVTMANAAGTVTAAYTQTSNWGSGAEGKYVITNGTSSSTTWTLTFTLPAGTTVSSSWDASLTGTGQTRTATGTWNATIAPGGTASFGFNTAGSGTPTACTINGANCTTGSQPSASPSTPTSPSASPSVSPSPSKSPSTSPSASPSPSTSPTNPNPGKKVVGYFTNWAQYARNYHVKNIVTSGSAAKLTHILYAFGNISGGQCVLSDTYNDYDRAYDAAGSVDGVADTWDAGALRGNFGQLRKLKKLYPNIKVIFSIGGWTYSKNFPAAAANPTAFANSCYNMIEDPRWADVFDGIDIDWEYPNACGETCDTSGFASFKNLMSALRTRFGANYLITAAITADGSNGGKIDAADYAGAAQYVDWYMPMSYDFFGAFNAQGPTAPHSPLNCYAGIPQAGFCTEAAIAKLKGKGIPAGKLLIGIGFYGRGWTGVTQAAPGGTATGAAPGTFEPGIDDYHTLKNTCPANGTVGGTAYCFSGGKWWSYDTPSTIAGKMTWAKNQSLGGAFFWELFGDTSNGELITAIKNGLA
ncbi:glycosyl hydrolase family 18 protein [Catellatospora sp. KI3]|uniref:glycosyl hydrolase family 18 protein n=1 Tax=Catellatospora sp. KI3 TaxID=3041620 RepID=UPI002482EDBF|nr:glycosyl hydrolase family 18 protein [Catellatospora sp. KI3]MDI1460560.1 glycosyl hydrolase family 18 protein [Catellatospora sp. KI3]